jgi:creatinine amidohydrolase
MDKIRYEEFTSPEIDALDRNQTVCVLPLGSVEQHGWHMPLGTDSMITHTLCVSVAERRSGATLVLPPPWYGFSAHHMRFAGSITLSASTMMALIDDIVSSLVVHRFRRILLVNGHGGNGGIVDLCASTLGHKYYGAARIAGVTYFHLAHSEIDAIRTTLAGGTGHAGEFETSVMLHMANHLVSMERSKKTIPDPGSRYLTTDLTGSSAVRTYLDFADLSHTGTLGDPTVADKEKGKAFFDAVSNALSAFVDDFANWKLPGDGK